MIIDGAQVSDEEIKQIKSISSGLPIILIGDKQKIQSKPRQYKNCFELEEPINHEELTRLLKQL